jgi:hypothetical protein
VKDGSGVCGEIGFHQIIDHWVNLFVIDITWQGAGHVAQLGNPDEGVF